jgi:hypothetical protein
MAKKNRGPKRRSDESLINLLNRRRKEEGHKVVSLIYPEQSSWAVGVKCENGKEYSLFTSSFSVNWSKEGVQLPPPPEKRCSCGVGINVNQEMCYSCWCSTNGPFF